MIEKTVKGDLIKKAENGEYDVIVHGCNCFCKMGAGIAKQIKKHFPSAYRADLQTTIGDKSKLGSYTTAKKKNLEIINAYTQYEYRSKTPDVDYDAVRSVFASLNHNPEYKNKKIGIPKIGSGLAGGNWMTIKEIINEAAVDLSIELVILPGDKEDEA